MARIFLRVYFGESWLGPGKVQLLEAIREHGSISAAARAIGMSYRRAWILVDTVNQMFRDPAVRTRLGGRGGGTAELTTFGAHIISRYRAMEMAAGRAVARYAATLERRVKPPATHRGPRSGGPRSAR